MNQVMSKGFNANVQVEGNKVSGTLAMNNSSSNTTTNNNFIHSPLEEESFFDWLFSLLPQSLKEELRTRVPTTDFRELSAIDVLHFQYNIVLLLIAVSTILVLYCITLIVIYRYSLKYRESITNKFTLLSNIIPSEKTVNNLIIILKVFAVLNIYTILVGLNFLFYHPFVFN